ncbi:MAG: hypothetical protein PHS05_02130 [Bacteroidales bacterium]|jgi:hypothetical protein|nr:hypothetical protein [Bacteroidales bacterium]
MTVFEYLNKNFDDIEILNKANMLKYKVIHYFSIYSRYLYYIEVGECKTKAVELAAKDNYVSIRRGFNAISEMEKAI